MIESLSIAVHAFVSRVSMSFSVDIYDLVLLGPMGWQPMQIIRFKHKAYQP